MESNYDLLILELVQESTALEEVKESIKRPPNLVWPSISKGNIYIRDMATSHLANAINLSKRRGIHSTTRVCMEQELEWRLYQKF